MSQRLLEYLRRRIIARHDLNNIQEDYIELIADSKEN